MHIRDPWGGQQVRFVRNDPTGRYSPIHERESSKFDEAAGAVLMVVAFSIAVASLLFWSI